MSRWAIQDGASRMGRWRDAEHGPDSWRGPSMERIVCAGPDPAQGGEEFATGEAEESAGQAAF